MNQNRTVFDIDEETDAFYLQKAVEYHEWLIQQKAQPRLTRTPIFRNREDAERRLRADYFDDHCKYPLYYFRRRFRMSRKLFLKIVNGISSYTADPLPQHFHFFKSRLDCTGRMSISALMKCTTAIRQMAYGSTPDAFDEYLQMSEHTARDALFFFNMCIIELYMPKYLRKPTLEDVVKIQQKHNNVHGFPGMLGSIDCMHWEWKNCPVSWQGQYGRGDKKYPTIMLEAVASQDLWIWHAFYGMAGANNDINVLDNSPLFDDLLDDLAPVVPYVVNGVQYRNGYYLADGIYPEWASFVKSFTVATDPKHTVTFTKPLNDKADSTNEISLGDVPHGTKESDPTQTNVKSSFAAVVNVQPLRKVVKINELRNELKVNGAAVTIPIEAVKAVNARFVNTLYGYFIGDRLAFPLVENYVKNTWAKYGLKRIQLHEEFFLFQFDTREVMEVFLENGPWLIRRVPLILNEWTSNTILKKDEIKHVPVWVKMHHVPIVAYSDVGLSLISTQIGRPLMLDSYTSNMCLHSWGRSTYARVLIEISADVDPMDSLVIAIPRCDKEGHTFATIDIEYEWTPPRCASCKIFDHVSDKCPKLPKEVSNVQLSDDGFTEVKKKKTKAKKNNKKQKVFLENVKNVVNGSSKPLGDPIKVSTQNSFSALEEDDSFSDIGRLNEIVDNVINDSDSEDVDEYITMEERGMNLSPKQSEIRHVIFENKLSVCAILESHVANRNLDRLCTHVFKHWKWVSNASSCLKGTRIIVGWNHDDVDVSVIHQESQVIHTRIWIKADKKEFFCSFVYAHNYYIHRRPLWSSLCLHKRYISNRPWCLLGDFNASLFVDDTSIGPSSLDITMRKFKECIETMEVMDVQRTRISDQFSLGFKGLVRDGWSSHVSGFDMFRVVKKLKGLKKPIRKMMYDKGNLHANVIRLRENLDRLQADLDSDPSNVTIREEEAAAVVAFNEALLLEEKLLKQKAKITWLRGREMQYKPNALLVHKSQEVKSAMFSMGNDKSPGPDGYTAAFFKDTWDIIGSDVTKAVCEFFTNGRLLKELNHTIIALIPKVNAPARVNDYRPISCCNVLFKCISKIIANRLKDCLKRLISPNQSAFVPGRRYKRGK
ncbi:retrovirus-related pol polyprotein from transposon 17.6 [Tanacetum coccineum]